jgi:hypothetical protein
MLKYVGTFAGWTIALMSGALSIGRELILIYRGDQVVPKSLFWHSVNIAFVLSGAAVLILQHRTISKLGSDLVEQAARSSPQLVGSINRVVIGRVGNVLNLCALMTIRNSGSPSVAEDFDMSVRLGSGRRVAGEHLIIQDNTQLFDPQKRLDSVINAADALYEKAIAPIPQGGRVIGWIQYAVPGVNRDELMAPPTEIEVTFRDVQRREIVTRFTLGKQNPPDVSFYYPGSGQPPIPEKFRRPPSKG